MWQWFKPHQSAYPICRISPSLHRPEVGNCMTFLSMTQHRNATPVKENCPPRRPLKQFWWTVLKAAVHEINPRLRKCSKVSGILLGSNLDAASAIHHGGSAWPRVRRSCFDGCLRPQCETEIEYYYDLETQRMKKSRTSHQSSDTAK